MTIHRFFVDPGTVGDEPFIIPASIARQVTRVLRLVAGDEIILLEGDGLEARCRLTDAGLELVSRAPSGGEPGHRLAVAQALLKGDHLEPVIRHGTEVGVSRFELVVTHRCIVRDLSAARLARLRAVAREAAEQSERGLVPEVVAPVGLGKVLGPTSVLLERSSAVRLSDLAPPARLIVGPEGGFTPDEVVAAQQAGALVAGLGPRILRSESVAVAAAAVVLSRTGDFA